LKEYTDKVPERQKLLSKKITALKDVKDKDDAAAIDTATSELVR
jgi:hypothetical protein